MEALSAIAKSEAQGAAQSDERSKAAVALSVGLKLAKRAMETASLDEAIFLLTNDTRSLVEFDRCFLMLHLGGESRFVGVSGQTEVDKKSLFRSEWMKLAPVLKDEQNVIFLSAKRMSGDLSELEFSEEAKTAVVSYMEFSGCKYFLCIPLMHRNRPTAHLVFEFIEASKPEKAVLEAVVSVAPVFGGALFEEWARSAKPLIWDTLTSTQGPVTSRVGKLSRRALTIIVASIVLANILFIIPTTFTVGGEVEIVPERSRMAFSSLDAIIQTVSVKEGESVTKGGTLAVLDPTELDYRISKCQREAEILAQEISVQAAEAYRDQGAWAKKKIAELRRQSVQEELQYLNWKRGFLKISAPVSGIIMTKNIESLKGKSLKVGEAFCEIAVPDEYCAEVRVSEERIGYVRPGQNLTVYLNTNPSHGFRLKVAEIAPAAKVFPRLGNVFPVRASFTNPPPYLRLGMKGMGKIQTQSATIWFIIYQRLLTRWNEFALGL